MVKRELRLPAKQARWRLALTGVLFGLALGAKWSIAPAALLPGLLFLTRRLHDHGPRAFARSGTRCDGVFSLQIQRAGR